MIIVQIASVEEAVSPQLVTVDPRMHLGVLMTGVDGSTWDMYGGPVRLQAGVRLGSAEPQHWTKDSPNLDGTAWQGLRLPASDPFWPVRVITPGGGLAFRDLVSAFRNAVGRGAGEVTMTVITPENRSRFLRARYVSGFNVQTDVDPIYHEHLVYGIDWLAADPFWHVPQSPIVFQAVDPVALFPGPPFAINPSNTVASASVLNPGDVGAWPVWTVAGPFTSFQVGVGASTVAVAVTKIAGESVTIDMDPRRRTVVDNAGANMWANVTDDTFAPIPPGESDLSLAVTGSGTGTTISLTFDALYHEAW